MTDGWGLYFPTMTKRANDEQRGKGSKRRAANRMEKHIMTDKHSEGTKR